MRVSRALEKLRRYLAAHGAAVTGLTLTGFLTAEAAHPVPARAAKTILQGTLQAVSTGPAANILLLSKGVSHAMKIIKIKYAALAAGILLVGAAVPPLVHAVRPHVARPHNISTPLRIGSATPMPGPSSQAPTLEQIQRVQLRGDFTLKYTLVEKDTRTPEMKASALKDVIDGLLDEAKQGLLPQSVADQAIAVDKAGYDLPSPPQEYRVIMSFREGKLLIVCRQQGAHGYGLDINSRPVVEPYIDTVFLYDGQTSYWYTSLDKILRWQQGFRTIQGLSGTVGTHLVPGIGLPYLPLASDSESDDVNKGGFSPADPLPQPSDTGRRCAVRELDIADGDGKAHIYMPGQVYAQESPQGLKLTKMLTGTADSPNEEWDYQEPKLFEGVWLPHHVHWISNQISIDGKPVPPTPRSVEDCQITEALVTPLAPLQFDMRTYLPANATIGVYRGEISNDKELRFPYNPAGGTLEEQYQFAVSRQGNTR